MRTYRHVAGSALALLLGACVGSAGPTSDGGPTGATVPTAPSGVTATAGVQSASLSWTAPTSNGGSPVLGYAVTVSPTTASATVNVAGTTASVTGLTNGATYTFSVSAFNAVGTGPASGPSNAITTPDVPGAPTDVVGLPGDQMVVLNWTAPASTGGSPVTSYTFGSNPSVPAGQFVVSGTTAAVTSLTNGTAYTFTVAAVNAVGTGPASLPSAAVTPVPPTTPPSGLTYATNPAVYTAGTAISPNDPSSTGGSVASYSVSPALPTGLTLNPLTGVITGTPTTASAAATYTVTATNSLGSTQVGLSITVLAGMPPTGLTYSTNPAVYTVGTAIAPNQPSSTGGPVTSYSVTPPLPSGLSLDTTTGIITGTPSAPSAAASYTVTATNSFGNTTVGLSITVNAATPGVPTLAQRRAFGAMAPSRGLTPSKNFTIRLQNEVLAGNCVVLLLDHSSSNTVSSITDDASNSWSSTPAIGANAGSGGNKTEAYVLLNANAGARNFTITFSAAENSAHFILLEYYNVAGVGVSASSTTAKAPTISTAAISPTAGSLVLHYSMDNTALIGETGASVSSFTAGSGWALEAADYASGTSGGSATMSFFVLQTRLAPGGSITPTVTTTGTNTVNSIALELLATSAGTAPPPGIRVLRMQDYLNVNVTVSTWSEPFPSSGNLLAVFDSNGNITSAISDSNGNAWKIPVKGENSVTCSLNYAANATTSPTLVMSWPFTQGGNANTTVTAYDIVGADSTNPYVQSVTSPFASVPTTFTGQPIITPQKANGVVIVVLGDGIGPIVSLNQPAGAYYLSANYPGEVDNDTIDNADGYALFYYGTNLAKQDYGWTLGPGTPNPNSANATAVEFAVDSSP